jgi:hypothetical protein
MHRESCRQVATGLHLEMSRRTNALHDLEVLRHWHRRCIFLSIRGFRTCTERVVMRYVRAPQQREVKLVVEDLTTLLSIDRDGWWCGPPDLVRPGEDYRFEIQGRQFPDPRSAWQPAGVRGPSRRIDHGTFRRTDLVRTEFDEQRRYLVIERGEATIACKFAREPTTLPVPAARPPADCVANMGAGGREERRRRIAGGNGRSMGSGTGNVPS